MPPFLPPGGVPIVDDEFRAYLVQFNEDGSLDPLTNQLFIDDWTPALQLESVFGSNAEPFGPNPSTAAPVFNGVVDVGFSDFVIDISGSTRLSLVTTSTSTSCVRTALPQASWVWYGDF